MSTIHRGHGSTADTATVDSSMPGTSGPVARYVAAALRLSLGWVFLWAFLDKTFGLGHETAGKDAWVNGGSPTKGFLAFAASGPVRGHVPPDRGTDVGRLALHARPPRHRRRPDARHRDAGHRRSRRAAPGARCGPSSSRPRTTCSWTTT